MYTQLSNRKLWYDGDSSFPSANLHNVIKQYEVKWVDQVTESIEEFNKRAPTSSKIQAKLELKTIQSDWLPEVIAITTEDVLDFIMAKHAVITKGMSEDEITSREIRLAKELHLFGQSSATGYLIRSIIHIVNELTKRKQVWGVGRGSSVSSYVLYVIGAHDVDSFAYDLDIHDFIPA